MEKPSKKCEKKSGRSSLNKKWLDYQKKKKNFLNKKRLIIDIFLGNNLKWIRQGFQTEMKSEHKDCFWIRNEQERKGKEKLRF